MAPSLSGKSNGHNHHMYSMHSISSPNPYSIGGIIPKNLSKNVKSFAKAQIPLSSLIDFKPCASTLAVYHGNYYKDDISCKKNRVHVRNSVNQEHEAQTSQEKEGLGNGGGSPSTSFLSILCPLLKLFSVSNYV